MKNLANCKPSEFLRQANKMRKSVARWLTLTDVMNIRKRQPPPLPDGASKEERDKALGEQAMANLDAMLNAVMEEHPDETLEVLALASFVEPENVDDHTVSEYLGSLAELMRDENVLSFLSSLLGMAKRAGLGG